MVTLFKTDFQLFLKIIKILNIIAAKILFSPRGAFDKLNAISF